MKKTVCIIGGGASGIMSAIAAARAGAEVFILEHSDRIGKKILLTGNGKCNITNLNMNATCYDTSGDLSFVEQVLHSFSKEDLMEFMKENGMRLMVNRESYVYPESEAAATVVNVLRRTLKSLKIAVYTGVEVKDIALSKGRYLITTKDKSYEADCLILACGGQSFPKTGSDGSGFGLLKKMKIPMIQPYPALTALISDKKGLKTISGIRANAEVTLFINQKKITSDCGQIQFTDYGISGIPVFQVSAYASQALQKKQDVVANVNLFPDLTKEQVFTQLKQQCKQYKDFSVEDALQGFLHKKWIDYLNAMFQFSHYPDAGTLPDDVIMHMSDELTNMRYKISAVKGYDFCQVTGGGVPLSQIDCHMQSVSNPGLYIVGEMLDVTGKCGGYNLQWAFSTGYIAGTHAAK